jgi:hypothetical protein
MQHIRSNNILYTVAAMGAALVLGCGNADADDNSISDELGQTEQATVRSQCIPSDPFHVPPTPGNNHGVDMTRPDWLLTPCKITSPTVFCEFPPTMSTPVVVALRNGWSSSQRTEMANSVPDMQTEYNNYFATRVQSGIFGFHSFSSQPVANATVQLDNGPIPGALTDPEKANWESVIHMFCAADLPLTEPYAGSARECQKWVATVDYNKFRTWGGPGRVIPNSNLIRKIFAVQMGLGLTDASLSGNRTSRFIAKTFLQRNYAALTTGGSSQDSWVFNYFNDESIQFNDLTCF